MPNQIGKLLVVIATLFAAAPTFANPTILESVNPRRVLLEVRKSKLSSTCIQLSIVINGQRYEGDPCVDRIEIETTERILNQAIANHEDLFITVSAEGYFVIDRQSRSPLPSTVPRHPVAESRSSAVQ